LTLCSPGLPTSKEGGATVKVEEAEQTAFLRHYMKCKIAMVRNTYVQNKRFCHKTIEICTKTEEKA
jgi:hypothetical protein